nr:reverse transcriptase domain-containing protein [Tanacetum cinerariifolium]
MVEDFMEVFMDDFSVSGNYFNQYLNNLDKMLSKCEETNLVLNWEKCHFMMKEGIVLGHKISRKGIEVDKAKIIVISKLPYPTNVKGVRSFLGHAGFYRRFIKDFSMISKLMTQLLMKDAKFDFSEDCKKSFSKLKEKLTTAPIIISPDWSVPFELICDASDFAVGAILGQRIEGAENLAADHLSRLENPNMGELAEEEIIDKHPDEHLMRLKSKLKDEEPWGNKYILVAVDYVFKWVEAQTLPTNDARVLVKFLKGLFSRFETNGQTKVTNRAIKRIMERSVRYNLMDWSEKLNDALWAFRTASKTPTGCTPFRMVYGKACHLQVEIEHKAYWELKQCNMDLTTAAKNRFMELNELIELQDKA